MKYLNPIYLKQTADFMKRYGLKSVLNKIPEYMQTTRGYQKWRKEHAPSAEDLELQKETAKEFAVRPLFSILVPTYNTDPVQLSQMAESVFSQTYDHWELCIADGSPKPSGVEEYFSSLTESDSRIRFASIENKGIAGNTNAAMEMASGDYIVLLDHDDMLSPDALFELAQAINNDPGIDVLYSDEDMVSADGNFLHNPNFKPDFSLDLLRSCNYITHLYAVRRELALCTGGFSEDCDGSQDYDFILKTSENGRNVCHIPKILYHWRVHGNSVAADSNNKTYAYDSAVLALQRHYERCHILATVTKDPQPGFYLTDYAIEDSPLVSVLMYHCADTLKDELIQSREKETGDFSESSVEGFFESSTEDFSESSVEKSVTEHDNSREQSFSNDDGYDVVNETDTTPVPYTLEFPAALTECRGEYILVLRNLQSISPDTIRLLLSNCMRSEIGIAAPRIIDGSGKVTESGLIYNQEGTILSPFAGKDPVYPGYHCYAICQHQVSLVGPYCFMTSMKNLRQNWPQKRKQGTEGYRSEQELNLSGQKTNISRQKAYTSDRYDRMADFCFQTQLNQKLITVIPRATAVLKMKNSRPSICGQIDHPAIKYVQEHPTDAYYTPNFSQKHPYSF